MNNLIESCVDRAKKTVPQGLSPEKWLEVYHEKFAELIVRECMSNLYLHGYDDAMIQIKKHFGVEE